MRSNAGRLPWAGAAPVIETERLIMRGLNVDAFPSIAEMWADPEVTRYVCGEPLNEEAAWSRFLRLAGHWLMMGYGYWLVEEKSTGDVIGQVGFGDFKREVTPSIKGEPEIGWLFRRVAHGKGFATEASLAAVQWGDKHFDGARMSCIIDESNKASIRVAQKCGFIETARADHGGDEIILMHRPA